MKTTPSNHVLLFATLTLLTFAGVHSGNAQVGIWTAKSPMPEPRSASAAAVVNGKMYVMGGNNAAGTRTQPEIYDPLTDSWSFGSPDPIARCEMAVGVLSNKVYVAGGWVYSDSNESTDALEIYDPATDSWTTGASMPFANGSMASAVIGGKLYVAGGQIGNWAQFSNLEIYDPLTDTWSAGASLPMAVGGGPVGVALNGKFYVVGGDNYSNSTGTATDLAAMEIYDPVSNTWTTGARLPMPCGFPAVGLIDQHLIVIRGNSSSNPYVSNVDIYDPVSNSWTTGTPAPQACFLPAACVMGMQNARGRRRRSGRRDKWSIGGLRSKSPPERRTGNRDFGRPQPNVRRHPQERDGRDNACRIDRNYHL